MKSSFSPSKISLFGFCTFLLIAFYPNLLHAQSGDSCDNARVLNCGTSYNGSTQSSTVSTFPSPSCTAGSRKDVFHEFQAFPGYTYTITVIGSDFDGVLLAYTGGCDNPTEIACADNGIGDFIEEEIEVSVAIPQTVIVRTYDYYSNGGNYSLKLECESFGNDICYNAVLIEPSNSSIPITVNGSTIGATSGSMPDPSCTGGSMNDVFYFLRASPGLNYTIRVNGDNYDGVLAAYTGSCNGGILTQIACADNGFYDNVEEYISFSVDELQYVVIQTYDYDDSGGDFILTCETSANNSSCSMPAEVQCGDVLNGQTFGATESGIANPSCNFFNVYDVNDVFYTFEAQPGKTYQIISSPEHLWRGQLIAYTGFNGSCGNLNEIACNLAPDFDTPAVIEFSVETAQTILLRTYNFISFRGSFILSLDCFPENNDCEDALPITCGSTVNGSTVGATDSGIPAPYCGYSNPLDVFYSLIAEPNIMYTATVNGANYDAIIAAYTGSCESSLSIITCADEGYNNTPETIEFYVSTTQTVFIRTHDWATDGGEFTLTIDCEEVNATCSDAISLDVNSLGECPGNAIIGNNTASSTSIDNCDSPNSEHTVFYTFNSGDDQVVQISFDDITTTDRVVQIREGCNGAIVFCSPNAYEISIPVTQNTDYSISVSTNTDYGDPGMFSICVTGLGDFCPDLGDSIGQPCDDGNPDTFNDEIQEDCTCAGTTEISAILNGNIPWNASCGAQSAVLSIYDSSTGVHISDYPTNINSSGQFTVNFNQAGTFDISLKVPGYLSVSLIDRTIVAGSNTLIFGAPLPGDLNNDNQINIADISFMTAAFGSAVGDPNFNPLADFNCDGVINILDVSAMTANFGLMGSSPINI